MSRASDEFLADSCSTLEYLHDRGEVDSRLQAVLTAVRYTPTDAIPEYIVAWNGRLVRVTAEDIGSYEGDDEDGPE